MQRNSMVTVAALALALAITLSVSAVGFADTSGQSNAPGNGRTGQFQNQMNSELIAALASVTGQTADQIQQQLSDGKTLSQLAQGLDQSALATAIQQAMTGDIQQRATQMAERLVSGQMPDQPGANSQDRGQSGSTNGIVLKIGSASMSVKGIAQDIDPGYQTSPVIINGRTFVPIRAIIESLGGKVDWSASDQKITITLNNTPIVLNIGNKSGTVNGAAKALDDAPFISATGRTMLPLRFVTENLGHNVAWDNAAKTITIQ